MNNNRITLLQSMPIFGGMSTTGLTCLIETFEEVHLQPGEFFFRENDTANSLFILESGSARVFKGQHQQSRELRTMGPGDCFGEMSLVDLNPRSASVIALSECHAVELNNTGLFHLYEQHTDQFALIQMNLLREVSRRLRDLDQRLSQLDATAIPCI